MGEYRMYSLVLRQLNPIQKGVQSAHSIVEYSMKFHKTTEFLQWQTVDKTIIMLDGGTYQEMKDGREFLRSLKVPYAVFHEPDLGGLVTSFSFLVEDKVWDSKTYPSYEDVDTTFDYASSDSEPQGQPAWLVEMGGLRNLQLRKFLMSKKLSA